MPDSRKIRIELTKQQLDVIHYALDAASRITMGQLWAAIELVHSWDPAKPGHFDPDVRSVLNLLTNLVHGHGVDASKGIYHDETPRFSKRAYDMYQTIRDFNTSKSDLNSVLQASDHEPIKITHVNDSEDT